VNEQLNISLQVHCVQLEVDDPRRISVHLAPIPQPPTRDNIVASQKSRFEDQDKTIYCIGQYVMPIILTWVLFCSKCAELLLDQEKQRVTI
jgi:hypothetical protein